MGVWLYLLTLFHSENTHTASHAWRVVCFPLASCLQIDVYLDCRRRFFFGFSSLGFVVQSRSWKPLKRSSGGATCCICWLKKYIICHAKLPEEHHKLMDYLWIMQALYYICYIYYFICKICTWWWWGLPRRIPWVMLGMEREYFSITPTTATLGASI